MKLQNLIISLGFSHLLPTSVAFLNFCEVYFPWDMGMLLFSELYAIGVPLFLPDRAWMSSIIKRLSDGEM